MPDPGRDQRDDELRHDDAGGDQHGRPLARAHGQHAAHQRQHRGVGEMEQQHAAGEDEQRRLCISAPGLVGGVRRASRRAAVGALRIDLARGDACAAPATPGSADSTVTMKTAARTKKYPNAPIAAAASAVADRGKARVAAEPFADRRVADQAEADRRDGRAEHAARRRMHNGRATAPPEISAQRRRPARCTQIAAIAMPATSRSRAAASTSAPPGICAISATKPAAESTRPISTCVHFCVVR